ncbi:YceH family protein [bacterium]|nr:YceH family protein [bacterium]
MDFTFQTHELRVLGCLIEKRFSTPDSYPLTLNSLVLACNQSSNRDPVVHYDLHLVDNALKSTRTQGYSLIVTSADARVAKFKENVSEKLSLNRSQAAILAELLLRGPQTPGELRQRTTRMYEFPDLAEVESTLRALAERESPLVVQLPQQPGKREIRWAQLLGGPIEATSPAALSVGALSPLEERVAALEQQMAQVLELLAKLST